MKWRQIVRSGDKRSVMDGLKMMIVDEVMKRPPQGEVDDEGVVWEFVKVRVVTNQAEGREVS